MAHRDEVGRGVSLLLLQVVQRAAELCDEGRQPRASCIRIGKLVVDVDAVEAVVLEHLDRALDERRAARWTRYKVKVALGRARAASDG